MRIVCVGGGPAGLFFSIVMKTARPDAAIMVLERNRRRRHVRLGRRLLGSDAREHRGGGPAHVRADRRELRALGRHRRALPRAHDSRRRSGVRGDRAQAAAGDPAGARRRARRRAAIRDRRRPPPTTRRRRRGRRRGRREQRRLRARARGDVRHDAARSGATATSGCGTTQRFDAFTFAFEETPHGWFQVHAYQFDAETGDGDRRVPRGDVACGRARHARRPTSRWRSASGCSRGISTVTPADEQRRASRATPGSVRAGQQRALVRRQPRADRRRRAHGALLDRFGHEARARGRDRAGACARQREPERARARVRGVRGGAAHRGAAAAERGAQQHRVVRERRALREPAARAVRLQPAHAQPAAQSR